MQGRVTSSQNKLYELLKRGMIGGSSILFTRYAEPNISMIISHEYEDARFCETVEWHNANLFDMYCLGLRICQNHGIVVKISRILFT